MNSNELIAKAKAKLAKLAQTQIEAYRWLKDYIGDLTGVKELPYYIRYSRFYFQCVKW